jgi:hypothetical protein
MMPIGTTTFAAASAAAKCLSNRSTGQKMLHFLFLFLWDR